MRLARLTLLAGLLLPCLPAAAAALPEQQSWHGKQIHLYDAQRAGWTGRGVTVAVLDGWIDRTHPDFQGRVLAGADCTSGTCRPGLGTDDHCGSEHGTHVAGTVASSSYGVAPGAHLLPVRVLTGSGDCSGDPTVVAHGIEWATDEGAQVINLSLGPDVPGGASSTAIPGAVRYAADHGVVVVFSAGNADLPTAQAYGQDALVVAATGPSGRLASYSQHGSGVSVAAPGGQPDSHNRCTQASCITSLYPGDSYAVAAGTSMAAPHVAGLAALLFQKGLTRDQVMARITGTAHPLAGAGHGLVDAAAALGVKVGSPSAAPRPRVSRLPTHRPVPARSALAVVTPSPVRPVIHPAPTPTPRPSPAALPSPSPLALAPTPDRAVPSWLIGVAGALVGLAGLGVMVGRRS